MKRRKFLIGLSAIGAAPAMPLGGLAASASASGPLPAGVAYWARFLTSQSNVASPDKLSQLSGLSGKMAASVHEYLMSQRVISSTGAVNKAIISRAVQARAAATSTQSVIQQPRPEATATKPPASKATGEIPTSEGKWKLPVEKEETGADPTDDPATSPEEGTIAASETEDLSLDQKSPTDKNG